MRTAFIQTLFELAQRDPNIVLIVGDLGFGVVNSFMQQLPDQYLNAGVAEQNMTGLAAGMALSGKTVFTYSIGNFPVLRCLEQIRNDVCYHNARVIVVAAGGGMVYGSLGISHHATEDLAIMRALPNMLVVAPNDPAEVRLATRALVEHGGPAYLRLGRAQETSVYEREPDFQLGRALTVRPGTDLSLLITGGLLPEALEAAAQLEAHGLQARVISLHTVKPLDVEIILDVACHTRALFTVEEHSIVGGLGGAVAEVLLEANPRPPIFRRIGLTDVFSSVVGDHSYLKAYYGLDAGGIVRTVLSSLV